MKVFLSWSNTLSHAVAKYFSEWLPGVIQECSDPFISSETAKGDPWFETITQNLEATNIGIIFITRENMNASWLNFEAGAMLNKFGKSGICPLLIGLKKGDYVGPMRNLQLTEVEDKDDMLLMMETLNGRCDKPLDSRVLKRAFDQSWNELVERVSEADAEAKRVLKPTPRGRSQEDKIEEILELVRRIPSLESSNASTDALADKRKTVGFKERQRIWRDEKLAAFAEQHGSINGMRLSDNMSFTIVDFKEVDGEIELLLVRPDDGGRLVQLRNDECTILPF